MEKLDKVMELTEELSGLYGQIDTVRTKINEITDVIDLSGQSFMINDADGYKSFIRVISKNKTKVDDTYDRGYYGIRVDRNINTEGTINYNIHKGYVYVSISKEFKCITEEEFLNEFTNAMYEISNFID